MSICKKNKLIELFCIFFVTLAFIGCKMAPENFYINFSDLNYGHGKDYLFVQIESDDDNFPVMSANCYWTFDGSEPSSDQVSNTSLDEDYFYMPISSDFYSGTIKFLCEITYSSMGKEKTETKRIDKEFTTKYHSINASSKNLDLNKNKGFQKEYSIGTVAKHQTDTITFTVKENGTVKIVYLMEGGFTSNRKTKTGEVFDSSNFVESTENEYKVETYKNVLEGDEISIKYENSNYIESGASSIKSGEYLIILE